jgi:hypothetical protein
LKSHTCKYGKDKEVCGDNATEYGEWSKKFREELISYFTSIRLVPHKKTKKIKTPGQTHKLQEN